MDHTQACLGSHLAWMSVCWCTIVDGQGNASWRLGGEPVRFGWVAGMHRVRAMWLEVLQVCVCVRVFWCSSPHCAPNSGLPDFHWTQLSGQPSTGGEGKSKGTCMHATSSYSNLSSYVVERLRLYETSSSYSLMKACMSLGALRVLHALQHSMARNTCSGKIELLDLTRCNPAPTYMVYIWLG